MKMKWSLLTVMLIAAFMRVSAQNSDNVTIGVRGGLTVPSLTGGGNPLSDGYSTTMRFGASVFADFKVTQTFSIQPMLEFAEEGAKKNGLQALTVPSQLAPLFQGLAQAGVTAPDYLYADYKSTAKMNYLMLPVLAKFGWNFGHTSPWRIYVDAGPYVGLLLNAKQVTSGNSELYLDAGGTQSIDALLQQYGQSPIGAQSFDATTSITDQIHRFNWGFEGNVGLQYRIKRNKIFIEGGGNYGLMNIQKPTSTNPDVYGNGKNHIGAATVMVGYAYAL